ncbi:MAG: lipid-A-disaccharide synthase [Rhodospirillales bacterium]|nr:lipid-A-disaccharide synthase [Rhodospirillales bacterium]
MSVFPSKIFLIAGEPSGDSLGAALMDSVREKSPEITFSGIGGPLMESRGLVSLFPMQDLAVMGLAEILPRLRLILRRIRETVAAIEQEKPGIVVTIDSPDFTLRVVRGVRRRMGRAAPKFVHYVAPSVWAWRPGRAKKLARLVDAVMCLLPFEPPFFLREGLRAIFVGHPVTRSAFVTADGAAFCTAHDIAPNQTVIGILPGSRRGEIARTGSTLFTAARIFAARHPDVVFVIPTLEHLRAEMERRAADLSAPVHIVTGADRAQALAACSAAMATSGTVGLELAAARVPHVIAYRMNALSWAIIRRMVRIKYAHLVNILLDAPVVPEFIQSACTPENIANGVEKVLDSAPALRARFVEALKKLDAPPGAVYQALSQCGDDFFRLTLQKRV